ncbi:hypothetical protein JL720_4458 [Aureococcus anophagefferens]|nr:hypothetical protein JL720_4458 [Aureococcus anophagefferens]
MRPAATSPPGASKRRRSSSLSRSRQASSRFADQSFQHNKAKSMPKPGTTPAPEKALEVDAIYTLDDLSRRATPNRHSDVWAPGGGMTPGGMTPGGATPGGATTTPAAAAAPADGATPSPLRLALSAVLEAVLDITLLEAETVREIALSPVLAGGWPALFEDRGSAPPWVEELCCGAGAGPGWLPACSCAADLDDDGRERAGTRLVDLDRGVRRYDGLDDDASDCSDDSDAAPYVNDELALILDPAKKEARDTADHKYVRRNLDPAAHPFAAAREHQRAVVAAKLDRMMAKPFVCALDGHRDAITCLGTPRRGQLVQVVSGGADGECRAWDLASRKCVWRAPAHAGPVAGVVLARAGDSFFSCGERSIKRWALEVAATSGGSLEGDERRAATTGGRSPERLDVAGHGE